MTLRVFSTLTHNLKIVPDGNRLLKMVLDLGTTDFAPEDVRVIVHGDRKLGVVARRETMLPATGKTTRRQFSRELDVNDSIDRSTVAAALDTGTGRLLIVAAFKNRESNDSTYSRWAPGSRSAIAAVQEVVQSAAGRASSTRLCDVELR
jgi:hypothetical protein